MIDIFRHTLGAKGWLKAWSIWLIAFPFYFFKGGSIQPSDFFIVVFGGLYFLNFGFKFYNLNKKTLKWFLYLCVYITIVNFIWHVFILTSDDGSLPWYIFSAFYYFNLFIVAFGLAMYKKYGRNFVLTTLFSLLFSGILQIVLSVLLGVSSSGTRAALFFTNPNQLGYYSLSALVIVLIMQSQARINIIWVFTSFVIFGYMALLSLSKAAMGSIIILFGVYLITNKILSFRNVSLILVLIVSVWLTFNQSEFGQNFLNNFETRQKNDLERAEANVSQFEYRGYDRIFNHKELLLFGAAEGEYFRFDTYLRGNEIHSSFGTILFCYGVPGFAFFLLFTFNSLKGLKWSFVMYSLPLFAYGLTHMGLRFSIFWVAISMFLVIQTEVAKKKYNIRKRRIEAAKNHHRSHVTSLPFKGPNEVYGFKGD